MTPIFSFAALTFASLKSLPLRVSSKARRQMQHDARQGEIVAAAVAILALAGAHDAVAAGAKSAPNTAAPSAAPPPFQLSLPVRCPEQGCFLARMPDHAPAKGVDQDYLCGARASNDHDGTDIAVQTMTLAAQTPVLAAAAGTVQAVRDGVADKPLHGSDAAAVAALNGQDCGNGVMIDHGNGWTTQYCHLKQGSIAVTPQQKVERGTPLGTVGMSGNSEFPHLHLTVRRQGLVMDPFTGEPAAQPCSLAGAPGTLWTAEARDALPYTPVGLYHIGFSAEKPTVDAARAGTYEKEEALSPYSPALILWAEVLSPQAGDVATLTVYDTNGQPMFVQQVPFDADKAQAFVFGGLKRREDRWAEGVYRGTVSYRRHGIPLMPAQSVTVTVGKP